MCVCACHVSGGEAEHKRRVYASQIIFVLVACENVCVRVLTVTRTLLVYSTASGQLTIVKRRWIELSQRRRAIKEAPVTQASGHKAAL